MQGLSRGSAVPSPRSSPTNTMPNPLTCERLLLPGHYHSRRFRVCLQLHGHWFTQARSSVASPPSSRARVTHREPNGSGDTQFSGQTAASSRECSRGLPHTRLGTHQVRRSIQNSSRTKRTGERNDLFGAPEVVRSCQRNRMKARF